MTEPIVINATNIGRYIDGLGVYTLNLLCEIAQMQTHLRFIIYVNESCREHLQGITFPPSCTLRWVSRLVSPDYGFLGHLPRLLYSNYLSLKHPRSLAFVATQLEAMFFRSKQIITIHDIIPLLFPKSHKKQYIYYRYVLPHVLRRARLVITPSQHTRELLVATYGLNPDKVLVIHNGVRQSLQDVVRQTEIPDAPYILFTGRLVGMKNFEGLLRAFSLIKDRVPHRLVLTGHGTRKMRRKLQQLRLHDCDIEEGRVVYKGHVPAEEMEWLYRNASLLVFPSFYEGFGFPPLEGMAHRVPVVVSRVSSLPEVCADAALYVDPYDVHSIADGMYRMLTDSSLRQLLIVKGVERVQHFRWEDSARKHMQVFAEAAG
ncbi:MAG TPA: glycosyltransferase family 1 protein [Bacteroidota bacterium]|nr:glycosyltransferase family 1 protein [Bacteroidota bacterium]